MACPFRLLEVGNIFKVENGCYCDVGKIYALRNFKFFPDVDFAVLIITDKIHIYIPVICNLYSIEMPINNVA
jgi:hypothetical protein